MGSLMHHQKSEREEALAHFSSIVDEGKEYISTRAWTMDGTEQNLPLLAEVMEGRKTDVRTVTSAVRRLKKAAAVVSDEQLQEAALLNVVYDYVVTNHDLDPVGLLTSSFARSLQFLNTINTSSSTMKLLLDEVNERADYSSIFDLPYVLSRACSRSQQQRQPLTKKKWRLVAAATAAPSSWKIAYVYVLCRLALDDLKRMPFLFTLLDWKQRVQSLMDKPLRTSRAAGSGMALFLFDWFLELDGRRETMPEGMTLKTVLGDLIGPPYNRLDFVAEATGLEYYAIAAFCAELLFVVEDLDYIGSDKLHEACRELLSSHIENGQYLHTLDEATACAKPAVPQTAKWCSDNNEEEGPRFCKRGYPISVELHVMLAEGNVDSAIDLAAEMSKSVSLSMKEKRGAYDIIFEGLLTSDLLFYNVKTPMLESLDFSFAPFAGPIAIDVFATKFQDLATAVEKLEGVPYDVKQHVKKACHQSLLRLLLNRYALVSAIPVEYAKMLALPVLAPGKLEEWAAGFTNEKIDFPRSWEPTEDDYPGANMTLLLNRLTSASTPVLPQANAGPYVDSSTAADRAVEVDMVSQEHQNLPLDAQEERRQLSVPVDTVDQANMEQVADFEKEEVFDTDEYGDDGEEEVYDTDAYGDDGEEDMHDEKDDDWDDVDGPAHEEIHPQQQRGGEGGADEPIDIDDDDDDEGVQDIVIEQEEEYSGESNEGDGEDNGSDEESADDYRLGNKGEVEVIDDSSTESDELEVDAEYEARSDLGNGSSDPEAESPQRAFIQVDDGKIEDRSTSGEDQPSEAFSEDGDDDQNGRGGSTVPVRASPPKTVVNETLLPNKSDADANTSDDDIMQESLEQVNDHSESEDDDSVVDINEGEDQSGEDQSGEDQSGEDQSGEDQSGEDQSGEDQSGEDRPSEASSEDGDDDQNDRGGSAVPVRASPPKAVVNETVLPNKSDADANTADDDIMQESLEQVKEVASTTRHYQLGEDAPFSTYEKQGREPLEEGVADVQRSPLAETHMDHDESDDDDSVVDMNATGERNHQEAEAEKKSRVFQDDSQVVESLSQVEAGYDGEDSQDAATEEEEERPNESAGNRHSFPFVAAIVEAGRENAREVREFEIPAEAPIKASAQVDDEGYEPEDSQGQTDVDGVPKKRAVETGYDAEDSQAPTEDEEVSEALHTEDEEERRSPRKQCRPENENDGEGIDQRIRSVVRRTLSEEMNADDEMTVEREGDLGAESSELEEPNDTAASRGVVPLRHSFSGDLNQGLSLADVAALVQIEHDTQMLSPEPHTRVLPSDASEKNALQLAAEGSPDVETANHLPVNPTDSAAATVGRLQDYITVQTVRTVLSGCKHDNHQVGGPTSELIYDSAPSHPGMRVIAAPADSESRMESHADEDDIDGAGSRKGQNIGLSEAETKGGGYLMETKDDDASVGKVPTSHHRKSDSALPPMQVVRAPEDGESNFENHAYEDEIAGVGTRNGNNDGLADADTIYEAKDEETKNDDSLWKVPTNSEHRQRDIGRPFHPDTRAVGPPDDSETPLENHAETKREGIYEETKGVSYTVANVTTSSEHYQQDMISPPLQPDLALADAFESLAGHSTSEVMRVSNLDNHDGRHRESGVGDLPGGTDGAALLHCSNAAGHSEESEESESSDSVRSHPGDQISVGGSIVSTGSSVGMQSAKWARSPERQQTSPQQAPSSSGQKERITEDEKYVDVVAKAEQSPVSQLPLISKLFDGQPGGVESMHSGGRRPPRREGLPPIVEVRQDERFCKNNDDEEVAKKPSPKNSRKETNDASVSVAGSPSSQKSKRDSGITSSRHGNDQSALVASRNLKRSAAKKGEDVSGSDAERVSQPPSKKARKSKETMQDRDEYVAKLPESGSRRRNAAAEEGPADAHDKEKATPKHTYGDESEDETATRRRATHSSKSLAASEASCTITPRHRQSAEGPQEPTPSVTRKRVASTSKDGEDNGRIPSPRGTRGGKPSGAIKDSDSAPKRSSTRGREDASEDGEPPKPLSRGRKAATSNLDESGPRATRKRGAAKETESVDATKDEEESPEPTLRATRKRAAKKTDSSGAKSRNTRSTAAAAVKEEPPKLAPRATRGRKRGAEASEENEPQKPAPRATRRRKADDNDDDEPRDPTPRNTRGRKADVADDASDDDDDHESKVTPRTARSRSSAADEAEEHKPTTRNNSKRNEEKEASARSTRNRNSTRSTPAKSSRTTTTTTPPTTTTTRTITLRSADRKLRSADRSNRTATTRARAAAAVASSTRKPPIPPKKRKNDNNDDVQQQPNTTRFKDAVSQQQQSSSSKKQKKGGSTTTAATPRRSTRGK